MILKTVDDVTTRVRPHPDPRGVQLDRVKWQYGTAGGPVGGAILRRDGGDFIAPARRTRSTSPTGNGSVEHLVRAKRPGLGYPLAAAGGT